MLENLRCLFLTEGIALLIRCFYRDSAPQETFGEYSSAAAIFSLLGMHTECRGNLVSPVSSRNVISQHKVNEAFLDDFFPFLLNQSPTCDIS